MLPQDYRDQINNIRENVCKEIRKLLMDIPEGKICITKSNPYQPFYFYKEGELFEYEIISVYIFPTKFNLNAVNGFNERKIKGEDFIEDVSDIINLYDAICKQKEIDQL